MRRGFSTVIAGGLIIFILSVLATIYLLYLDANQYKLNQTGESISANLKRESEMLHLSVEDGDIRIRNLGPIPVKIKYIAQKTLSGFKFKEVNLTIDVGNEVRINNLGVEPENLLFISSRGKVFTVDNLSGQIIIENKIFEWVNSTHFTLNIPINISESLYPIENSILSIYSRDYGYIVIDLYRGSILYQGKSFIIPSRDGGVIYVNGKVYVAGREVLNGDFELEYVGYDYLVVSGISYVYLIVSDGSVYPYTSSESTPKVFYNGENLVIIGYIDVVGDMYRYYLAQISPFNYSLLSYYYLDLPIQFSEAIPSNVYLPGKSTSYITSPSSSSSLIGVTSYKINFKGNLHHVFSSSLKNSGDSLSWMFKYWYFNIDGDIRNSSIDYIKSLSTLDRGLPMEWRVTVHRYETPYIDEDVRVYNLSSSIGFLSIDSELLYGYSGLNQVGEHHYKYILSGDTDFLEIDVKIIFSASGASFNVSVYSFLPGRELLASYEDRITRPLISLNVFMGANSGKGAIHLYDKSNNKPYVKSLMFEFQKPNSNLLLKIVNSTNVLVTSNNQFSRMSIKVYVSNRDGFYINPATLDYLVDRKLNGNSIYISSVFAVIGGPGLQLDYVNSSISIPVRYGVSTSGYASTYLMSLPSMNWNSLSYIDSVGLYIVSESGAIKYSIDSRERYDWKILTYSLIYTVVSTRFGGVDIYVHKY